MDRSRRHLAAQDGHGFDLVIPAGISLSGRIGLAHLHACHELPFAVEEIPSSKYAHQEHKRGTTADDECLRLRSAR